MKKFFSAILLMTMMVFSVGTFVSCNDLVNEIEDVKGQTTEQAAAIKALENEIAALETALATAQKAADDAKAAANDAKAAAAQAKADAIADAKAQVEALKTALETAIAEKADKAVVDAMAKDVEAALAVINTSIAKLAEKDAALERRFQPVLVGEPTVEDTIAILRGLKERYEVFHGVKIQDAGLIAAAGFAVLKIALFTQAETILASINWIAVALFAVLLLVLVSVH